MELLELLGMYGSYFRDAYLVFSVALPINVGYCLPALSPLEMVPLELATKPLICAKALTLGPFCELVLLLEPLASTECRAAVPTSH